MIRLDQLLSPLAAITLCETAVTFDVCSMPIHLDDATARRSGHAAKSIEICLKISLEITALPRN